MDVDVNLIGIRNKRLMISEIEDKLLYTGVVRRRTIATSKRMSALNIIVGVQTILRVEATWRGFVTTDLKFFSAEILEEFCAVSRISICWTDMNDRLIINISITIRCMPRFLEGPSLWSFIFAPPSETDLVIK